MQGLNKITSLFSEAPGRWAPPKQERVNQERKTQNTRDRTIHNKRGEKNPRRMVNGSPGSWGCTRGRLPVSAGTWLYFYHMFTTCWDKGYKPLSGLIILLHRTRFPCGLISCSADLLVMNSFNFFESVYLALLLRDIFSGYKILC